jgi:uncharacterized protein
MSVRLGVLLWLWLSLYPAPAAAVPLWSVSGTAASEPGEVLLLGSVHLLRAEDLPLPEAIAMAYGRAERVVMELHPDELSQDAAQAAFTRLGVMNGERSTRALLSEEEWRTAEQLASAAGVSLRSVGRLEPWFAALALYNGRLAAAGYDAALGVDQQVADWARRDNRPTAGLETLEEQLLLFKELDADAQRRLLMNTLEELATVAADTAGLVATWREGDMAALEAQLERDFAGYEPVRERLVEGRNRAWVAEIEALLEEPGTSLVVVGALHLVGPEGLPALLESRGHVVRRTEGR